MKVYVDNFGGKNIGLIEVDCSDTVLAIKEKIWRCLRIPVSKQFLYFKSKILLKDHVNAARLKIVSNSHLQVYVVPNRNHPIHKNNQVLDQTKNSPAPSNSTQQIIHGHQHLPVTRRRRRSNNIQVLPSDSIGQDLKSMIKMPSFMPETTQRISHIQDSPVMVRSKNMQVLQTEQSPVPSEHPWTTEEMREVQSFWPERTNEIINSQDLPVMVRRNNNQSRSLSETEELLGIQDYFPYVTVGSSSNTNTLYQTESDFFKEIINIPDSPAKKRIKTSPMKLTVMVKPSEDTWRIPLEVNDFKEIINSQDLPVMVRRNNNQSRSLSETEELLGIQDYFPYVTVGSSSNTNTLFQTESDFFKEIINIPDSPAKKRIKTSPMKLTVMVKPAEDTWRIPLEVNADDNVTELRKELVRMQERGELNLPQEGFFLMHEYTILNENQSFSSNGVTQYGTIEIFGEYFTSDDDYYTTTRVPSFGH